jgi:hypothetical protein
VAFAIYLPLDAKFFSKILAKGKLAPTRVTYTNKDYLHAAGMPRGTLIIGDPGTGKSKYSGGQIVKIFKEHPDQAIFVFDWSGSLTNTILELIAREPNYRTLLNRVVLDELGNEKYVCPMPEFHKDYGLSDEEQVTRVTGNFSKLASIMAKTAQFLVTVSIADIGLALCKMLVAVVNPQGDTLQITEGKRLLLDLPLLGSLVNKYGGRQPSAKEYFEREYLDEHFLVARERELQSKALRHILGAAGGNQIRAILGWHTPGWTPREAIEKGLMVIIDAHKMINQEYAQHYLLIQKFSLIMTYINKREADDPNNIPATIVFDETYTILKIPGMAEWLGMISPLYRNRKFQLIIIIQALWQLDKEFKEQIWTLGNIVAFAVSVFEEAEIIAKTLFSYNPDYVKYSPKTDTQNPVNETEKAQDRINADWLQNLQAREVVMRRYINEQQKENYPAFIRKTTDMPSNAPYISVREIKEMLTTDLRRNVAIRDALEYVNGKQKQLDKVPTKKSKAHKKRRTSRPRISATTD